MINSSALLTDLRRLMRVLEADLRTRIDEQPALSDSLQEEWKNARDAGRTGVTYAEWLDDEITQAAVHWVLGCVYLRFLEDNHFLNGLILQGLTRSGSPLRETATSSISGRTRPSRIGNT